MNVLTPLTPELPLTVPLPTLLKENLAKTVSNTFSTDEVSITFIGTLETLPANAKLLFGLSAILIPPFTSSMKL